MTVATRTYKGRFPFRLGCTSYVVPADIEPNVRFMAPVVDDVELVLFESEAFANLPTRETIVRLANLAREHDITFTVHFPLDAHCGSPQRTERDRFVQQALRIIDLAAALAPWAYIVHLEGLGRGSAGVEVERWTADCRAACEQVLVRSGIAPELLAVENLGYTPCLHTDIVRGLGLSYCLDIGHLWAAGGAWETYCREVIGRTRVVHLHGIHDGRDHVSLAATPKDLVSGFVEILRGGYNGVVTLEVFNELDTFGSLEVVDKLWHA